MELNLQFGYKKYKPSTIKNKDITITVDSNYILADDDTIVAWNGKWVWYNGWGPSDFSNAAWKQLHNLFKSASSYNK